MTTTVRRCATGLLPLILAGALAACGTTLSGGAAAHPGTSKAAASARAYVHTRAFQRAENTAKAHATACAKSNQASLTGFVHCVAPKGTFKTIWHCVKNAILGHLFSHPVKEAEAAAPNCVATQEVQRR